MIYQNIKMVTIDKLEVEVVRHSAYIVLYKDKLKTTKDKHSKDFYKMKIKEYTETKKEFEEKLKNLILLEAI